MILAELLKVFFRPHDVLIPEHLGIQELILLLKDADPGVRRQAVRSLGDLGDPLATIRAIDMLNDADDGVRLEAVVALGKIGDPRAVEPLIEKLEGDDYFYVRKKAAYTLYVFFRQKGLNEELRQKILSRWRSWYLT
jgi:HEAT repeat protein